MTSTPNHWPPPGAHEREVARVPRRRAPALRGRDGLSARRPIAEALIAAVRPLGHRVRRPATTSAARLRAIRRRRLGLVGATRRGRRTTTDVSVVIVEALRRLIRPGDGVVITPPVYPPFFDLSPRQAATSSRSRCSTTAIGYSLDLGGIERALAAGARAFLLCNPHNPARPRPQPPPSSGSCRAIVARARRRRGQRRDPCAADPLTQRSPRT